MTDDRHQPTDAEILYRVPPGRPTEDDVARALQTLVNTIPLNGDIPGAVDLISVTASKDDLDVLRDVLMHYLGTAEK